jgi:hypothetical protein
VDHFNRRNADLAGLGLSRQRRRHGFQHRQRHRDAKAAKYRASRQVLLGQKLHRALLISNQQSAISK